MEDVEVAVIGAGQAGLAVSYYLTAAGRSHVVLERGRIGESWRSQRWDSFVLNSPNELTLLPGQSVGTDDPEGFWSRDAFVSRLHHYATDQRLPVREHTPVVKVEPRRRGGFTVTTGGADPGVLDAWAVVVASGIMQQPRVPALSRDVPDQVRQLHTAEYRNPQALPDGAVLVVGSAQSGCQIVEDLLAARRHVYLATSRVPRAPRRYRGRDVLAWMAAMGSFEMTAAQLDDPAQLHAPQPQISGVGPRGHSVSLQQLAHDGATLLGHLQRVTGATVHLADDVSEHIHFADNASAETKRKIDEFIDHETIAAPPHVTEPPDEGDAPCADPDALAGPRDLDLDAADIQTIIWCTGFSADFSWLHLPVLDEQGMPLHHDGISPIDRLAFVGFPWLRRRGSGIVYGVDADARFIVNRLDHQTDTP